MDKKLQDLTWSVLPKEFKEGVKKLYVEIEVELSKEKGATDNRTWQFRGMKSQLAYLFGIHNLTSDAEGEIELLRVTRQKVMGLYANAKKLHGLYTNATCINEAESRTIDRTDGAMSVLKNLFGSKCLPDEEPKPAEPKFKVGELCMRSGDVTRVLEYNPKHEFPYTIHVLRMNLKTIASESDLEPYTEPEEPTCTDTCTDDCPSQSRNLSQETANCDKCNDLRLHIATMALQGILGNADRMKSYEQIAMSEPYEDLSAVVARNAVRYANALIAECLRAPSQVSSVVAISDATLKSNSPH